MRSIKLFLKWKKVVSWEGNDEDWYLEILDTPADTENEIPVENKVTEKLNEEGHDAVPFLEKIRIEEKNNIKVEQNKLF